MSGSRSLGATALVASIAITLLLPGPAQTGQDAGPIGRHLLATRGIWTEFEDPSAPNGWYSGELLQAANFESALPHVAAQLDAMRAMGVNEIAYELRSGDPTLVSGERTPPDCNVSPDTGLRFPQPTPDELANLGRLFDLVAAKRMRVALLLNNTHMEERARSEQWLAAILSAVKGKRALDYVAFGGDTHLIDLDGNGSAESCGGLSEAPLWLGPRSKQGAYVQWAIGLGLSLGVPARRLTAESIVGFYPHQVGADAGPDAEDSHLWRPLSVMRTIFDRLGIRASERTYAISFYRHHKCSGSFVPCVDEDPQVWAEETAKDVRAVAEPESRVTAVEFGDLSPIDPSRPTEQAVEGLGVLMQRYGIDGGTYWRWHDVTGDAPSSFPDPVKRRGRTGYFPVQRELADLYGFHLIEVPNGSFEQGSTRWKIAGRGTALPLDVAAETTQAPWRGRSALRLAARDALTVSSARIRVSPGTRYTTTGTFRMAGTGDASVAVRYWTCSRSISRARALDRFTIGRTTGFATVPLAYTTPKDACFVQLELSTRRGATLDVDHLR